MSILFDSDVLIDATSGRRNARALVDQFVGVGLGLSIVSYGELLEGVSRQGDAPWRRQAIEAVLEPLIPYTVSVKIMRRFAAIRANLRSSGLLIADFDLVIAATAIEHDLRLITRNLKHFERIPGLRFNSPEELLGD